MKTFKKLAIFSLIGLLLIALPITVLAFNKDKNQSIYVGPEEIIEGNFIKAGNFIDINGAVNGDVIVVGNSITVAGPVAGDVIAAGNIVRITGSVSGSVRVVGGSVEISSEVERNVWAVGNSVALGQDSKVGWDIYSAGASVEVKGPVGGNIWAAGANVVIANEVGKDVNVSVDTEGQIILYPEAKVGGNLTYKAGSEEQLVLKDGAEVIGKISKKAIVVPSQAEWKKFFGGAYLFFKVVSLFGLLVIGLVLVSLIPKIILEVKEVMVKKSWVSLGWGLVYLILTPVIVILLMITIIGLPLAFIIIPLYVIGLYLSKILVGFVIGLLIFDNLAKDKKYKGSLIWPLVLGLLVFVVVTSIPFVGWIIKLLLILWALGAAIQVKTKLLKEYR